MHSSTIKHNLEIAEKFLYT